MKIKALLVFLLTSPLLASGQSIRNGVDESNFNTITASEFDLSGVWQGNRFEVVYDSLLNEVVRLEFEDSISNLVFIRYTMENDVFYKLIPLNIMDTAVLGQITMMRDSTEFFAFSKMNSDIKYEHFSEAVIYGVDAIQLNIDVPESKYFFGKEYKPTEDLNVFWEFIRYYPN